MKRGRPESARQIVSDPSPREALALEALEADGFRIAGNPHRFSKYVLIECRLPIALRDVVSPDNPNYQAIIAHQCELARLCLRRVGLDVDVHPFGWRLTIWLSMSRKPRRKGRPRESREVREQVGSLRDAGHTYPEIAKLMKEHKSPDTWRKLHDRK